MDIETTTVTTTNGGGEEVINGGALATPSGTNVVEDDDPSTLTLPIPIPPRAPVMQQTGSNDARLYWDRSHYSSPAEQMKALSKSATLYVGNLAFTTRSVHVTHHFSMIGLVKRVIMGLDRLRKTPCGFCFVEYYTRSDALCAVSMLSGTKLDGRVIRVELDAGFQPGRQYGRGASGGQVRDDIAKRNKETMNKRKRNDTDGPPPPPKPVSLDGALPSARSTPGTESNNNNNNNSTESVNNNNNNDQDDDDRMEDAPSAKRQRREE